MFVIEKGFMGLNYFILIVCVMVNYVFYVVVNYIRNGDVEIMIVGGFEVFIIFVGLGGFVVC